MPHKNDQEIFPPFRLVAQFEDGTRRIFDGLTWDQAYQAVVRACGQHGDTIWYDGVTDEHYTNGVFHQLRPGPAPIHLPFPILDITDYHGDDIPDVPLEGHDTEQ